MSSSLNLPLPNAIASGCIQCHASILPSDVDLFTPFNQGEGLVISLAPLLLPLLAIQGAHACFGDHEGRLAMYDHRAGVLERGVGRLIVHLAARHPTRLVPWPMKDFLIRGQHDKATATPFESP